MRGKHLRGLRCALVLACARALYEEAASIETLADFKSVLASNETWLVHFCVPDVEGCEVFAPGFAPIAEEIVQFGIRVGFVEPSEKNQKMFAGMGVQRFKEERAEEERIAQCRRRLEVRPTHVAGGWFGSCSPICSSWAPF